MQLRLFTARVFLIAFLCAALEVEGQVTRLSPTKIAEINGYVKAEMARQRIPGVEVGIYRDGSAILEKGYGLANIEWQVPVGPKTIMQSGSVGKQFTATAVMMLVEQGKVGLDDSIAKYFPDAPASWQPIKVKNLLSHTSGLADYSNAPRAKRGGEFDIQRDFSEEELLHKIEQLPIDFKSGDEWSYCNTNYVLLGILIHHVTGTSYGDYLHEKIFAPLGMTATRLISDREIISRRAAGYEIHGGKILNQEFVSATFNSTADGALYFNVADLEKWDRALTRGAIVSQASLKQMWTLFSLNDGKSNAGSYGFGWRVHEVNGHRVIEHAGVWQGFTCILSRYVDDKITVVVLTNLDGWHARPTQIERVVAGLVEPSLMPKPQPAIADARVEIAATLRDLLLKAAAGTDASSSFSPTAGYDASLLADLQSGLPADWEHEPFQLVERTENRGVVVSSYRVGKIGDFRLIILGTNATGKIEGLAVFSDPYNR